MHPGAVRVYGIIGHPIAHSLSPAMQNAAFAATGFPGVYVPFAVAPADLTTAIAGLRAAGIAGLNVTVPHKEAMLGLADALSPRAQACGAVNTVIRTPRGLVGDNTDGAGFVAALADAGRRPRGLAALVIGAGGSARAIVHALLGAGTRRIVVANRTRDRAEVLVAGLADARAHAAPLDVLTDRSALAAFGLIVNCTSAALGGAGLPPLAFAATPSDALVCDLLYGPTPSSFLRRAAAAGRPTMDGRGMLLHQGALAFTLWTRRPAPLAVMRRALERALAHS